MQSIAAHSYMAILVRGVIPQKSSHCNATLTPSPPDQIINTPSLLHQFTPINKLPPLLKKNGRILGRTFYRAELVLYSKIPHAKTIYNLPYLTPSHYQNWASLIPSLSISTDSEPGLLLDITVLPEKVNEKAIKILGVSKASNPNSLKKFPEFSNLDQYAFR